MDNGTATDKRPQRLQSPDIIKGLVILVIISFHIIFQQESHMTTGNDEQALIMQILYTGLMVFFIISGYFFRPGRSYKENVRKRALQLFVLVSLCIIIFPAILYGYVWIIGEPEMEPYDYWHYSLIRLIGPEELGQKFTLDMEKSAIDVFAGYYFLQAMLVGFLIFYAIADRVLDDPRKFLASIILLLCGTWIIRIIGYNLPYYLGIGLAAAAFMLVGALLGKHKTIEYLETYPLKEKNYWVRLVIAIAVTAVVAYFFHPGTGFYAMSFGTYSSDWGVFEGVAVFPFFIVACGIAYIIMVVCSLLCKVPILSTALSYLGKHTLAILLLHEFLAKMIIAPFYTLTDQAAFPTMPMWFSIPLIFVVLGLSLAIAHVAPKVLMKIMGKMGKPAKE